MRHRVFIAINLPENIKEKLAEFKAEWPDLPCRWTKTENLHITLIFLGSVPDEELLNIIKSTREVAAKRDTFFLNLRRIAYGPEERSPRSMSSASSSPRSSSKSWTPRMVWAEGEISEDLGSLQKSLEVSLEMPSENRPYALHITLGRLKQWEFQKIDPEEIPGIKKEINLNFEVNSIEVMESASKRGGPEYVILESAPLGIQEAYGQKD